MPCLSVTAGVRVSPSPVSRSLFQEALCLSVRVCVCVCVRVCVRACVCVCVRAHVCVISLWHQIFNLRPQLGIWVRVVLSVETRLTSREKPPWREGGKTEEKD